MKTPNLDFLTVRQFAEHINVGEDVVRLWLRVGMPKAIKKPIRINLMDAIDWLNNGKVDLSQAKMDNL